MIRIYVRKPGEQTGRVYRAKSSVMDMKVAVLGFQFVRAGVITEEEWGHLPRDHRGALRADSNRENL